jgi:hypothetical protein
MGTVGSAFGREVTITSHAVLRWIERVAGLDLQPFRHVASSMGASGKSNDRTVERIMAAFGFDLDGTRRIMLEAMRTGVPDLRERSAHVMIAHGHRFIMVAHDPGTWSVLTVLSPGMEPGESAARREAPSEDQNLTETDLSEESQSCPISKPPTTAPAPD